MCSRVFTDWQDLLHSHLEERLQTWCVVKCLACRPYASETEEAKRRRSDAEAQHGAELGSAISARFARQRQRLVKRLKEDPRELRSHKGEIHEG